MSFCTKCGKELNAQARFCSNCGSQVTNMQQPMPQHSPQVMPAPTAAVQTVAKGSSVWKWVIALIAVTVVIATVVICLNLGNLFKSDETLIRERIQLLEDALNQGDWDGIMDCLDRSGRAAMELTISFSDTLFSEFTGFELNLRDLLALGGIFMEGDEFHLKVTDIRIDGDRATVTVVMSTDMYDLSQSEQYQIPMIKENGNWYVSGFENFFDIYN